jgi:hypothetical protein
MQVKLLRHAKAYPYVKCHASEGRAEEPDIQAFAEAVSIFEQARTMATLQTQHELEQAFLADLDLTATVPPPEPSPRRALISFWCEQGLSSSASEQLVRLLEESGRMYSLEQLSAKVQRLNRILPDADVPAMVNRVLDVLDVDAGVAIRNMVSERPPPPPHPIPSNQYHRHSALAQHRSCSPRGQRTRPRDRRWPQSW